MLKENEELHALIENHDDVLRMAKKKRKELRAEIDERGEMIGDLESKLLDAKLEIESLKSTPIVSYELECFECDVFLAKRLSLGRNMLLGLMKLLD